MALVPDRLRRCTVVLLLAVMLAPPAAHAQVDQLDSLRARIVELYRSGRYSEAIPVAQQALALTQTRFPPGHAAVGVALDNVAVLLITQGRFAEAEPLSKRAVAIFEKALAADDPHLGIALDNLASILTEQARYAEVEPLRKRALAVAEKKFQADSPELGTYLTNLADLYARQQRYADAEPLARRALQSGEPLGSEHSVVALRLGNLAWLLKEQKRYGDAEPMMRRALAINEKQFGADHPHVATSLNNLALLLMDTGRLEEAERLMRRALAIDEASFGATHQLVARRLDSLAALQAERGNWAEAAALGRRASAIWVVRGTQPNAESTGFAKAALASSTWSLRAHARAVFRADPAGAAAREIGFELAQWALQSGAADALSQMSARFARGTGPLATLVRERQDIQGRRQGEDRRLLAALGRGDAPGSDASRQAIAALDAKLRAIDAELRDKFKEYADLADPRPLTIGAVQSLLSADEALVFFLDLPQFGRLPEETLVFALTRTGAHWHSTPLGTGALSERITALRCGLDRDGEWVWSPTVRRWLPRKALCQGLWPSGLRADEPLPFDFARAQQLHAALLGPIADLIAGKRLLVVASGPLTTLPLHVLVSKAPDGSHAGMEKYRSAAWLGVSHAISVLPSVGSLPAVRKLARSQASEPYIGFGNPLLEGRPGDEAHARRAAEARDRQRCPIEVAAVRQQVAQAAPAAPVLASLIRGGSIDLAAARRQVPLPETRDELCAVAKSLGALGKESETVWLGARASEANLKRLDKAGKLARYRVVHFATHGLLAGETEAFSRGKAEPALMLTPPADGRSAADLSLDDGFLMASEVAQLKLDADWVVLSACNTAAGEGGDAEALSGLARAFFYAKARALLVSHWYVDSASTVALITGAFAELRASDKPGRAEALRRAMQRLIGSAGPLAAHPASWAPFVLVGEGGQ